MNFECHFFFLSKPPTIVGFFFFSKVSFTKMFKMNKTLCVKFPLYEIRRGGVDSLNVLRKGHSERQNTRQNPKGTDTAAKKNVFFEG